VTVIPGALETAPLNTHVWVYLDEWDAKYCTENPRRCEDTVRFELRTAPSGREAPRLVATTVHRHETEVGFVLEIVPLVPLAPKSRYEVWSVEQGNRRPDVLHGTVKTGSKRDDASPTWPGQKRVERQPPPKRAKRIVTWEGWSGLSLFADDAQDSEGRVLYAVWLPAADGRIDFSHPAAGYTPAIEKTWRTGRRLGILGSPGGCEPSNFKVPAKGQKPLRLGLAAVDLAGNRSQPVEVDVQ